MRLGVVCCGNGLGHAKRSILISSALAQRIPRLNVSFFLDRTTRERLLSWAPLADMLERHTATITEVDVPVRWIASGQGYGDWLTTWAHCCRRWGLSELDAVISDNLVEVMEYADDVVLVGSFFWHDVLRRSFPESEPIARYADACEGLLANHAPTVFANRYFAMPRVCAEPNVRCVGLVSFEGVANGRSVGRPARVLLAPGNADLSAEVLRSLRTVTEWLAAAGLTVVAEASFVPRLGPVATPLEVRTEHHLRDVDLAVIRGGLGTISECVAARVSMLYVDDFNPEIRFNVGRVEQLGIGQSAVSLTRDQLFDVERWKRMADSMSQLDLDGVDQIATALVTRWHR